VVVLIDDEGDSHGGDGFVFASVVVNLMAAAWW
jgi:hypothetical protein